MSTAYKIWMGALCLPAYSLATRGIDRESLVMGVLWSLGAAAMPKARAAIEAYARDRIGVFLGAVSGLVFLATLLPLRSVQFTSFLLQASLTAFVLAAAVAPRLFQKHSREALLAASALVGTWLVLEGTFTFLNWKVHQNTHVARLNRLKMDKLWEKAPMGRRSFHLDHEKPPGTTRLLALGDSFTWGWNVERTEDTWPYFMERKLREQGLAVEAINFGEPAFSTMNELELLRNFGDKAQADHLILQYLFNDAIPSGPEYTHFPESWLVDRLWRPLPAFDLLFKQKSSTYRWIMGRFTSDAERIEGYHTLYADGYPPWEASRQAMKEIVEWARERKIGVTIVLWPLLHKGFDERYPYSKLHVKLRNVVEDLNVPFVDLLSEFRSANPEALAWSIDAGDAHPNVAANKLAGEFLATYFAQRLRPERALGSAEEK